ncbi:uncharacterized protein LOC135834700 isoform X1 [Planococcus citri]|uniref:uncharacterized protein LOC135834700 isoform X1 n=1 Tax=Planococcus citri TaxID=170843 RepID=UPI0031F8B0A9
MDIKLNIFITIISITSSYGLNHDTKPAPECKLVHSKNCIDFDKCTVGISVINKCPTNHPDQRTKNRCENFVDSNLLENTFLFRPVTNKLENITYWNIYCAWCNHQNIILENFAFWSLKAYHVLKIEDKFDNQSKPVPILESNSFISDVDLAVLEKMVVQNDSKLISQFHGRVRRVVPLRYLPPDLRNSSFEFCSLKKNNESDQFQVEAPALVPKDFSCAEKKFCSGKKIPQPESCKYFDRDDQPCSINQFLLKNIDFVQSKSKIIRQDGKIFDRDAYDSLNEDLIFLCGTKTTNKPIQNLIHKLTKYMKFTSTLLLFMFLMMKTNKKTFKSLPNLVLYSYCVALLDVYLYQIFSHFLSLERYGVVLKTYVLIYTFLCHAFWACIISYEYWYVISTALKVRRSSIEMKRYWIYGFVGWVLPALLLCAAYTSLTEEDKKYNCFSIDDHKNINIAESFSGLAYPLHVCLVLLSVIIFFVLIPVLAVQGWFFIRLVNEKRETTRRQSEGNSNATRQISELDYLFIFSKIAYLMGIHWMMICINLLLSFLDISALNQLGSVLFSCHGTFIFFAFGYKNVRKVYESTYKSRGTQSTEV